MKNIFVLVYIFFFCCFVSCTARMTRLDFDETLQLNLTGEIHNTSEISSPIMFSYKEQPCFGFFASRNNHFYIHSISNDILLDSFDLKEFKTVSGLSIMKGIVCTNTEILVANPDDKTISIFNLETTVVQKIDLRKLTGIDHIYLVSLAKNPLIVTDSFIVCPIAYTDIGLNDSLGMNEYFKRPTDILIRRNGLSPRYESIGRWPSNYCYDFFYEMYSRKYHVDGELYFFPQNSDSTFVYDWISQTYYAKNLPSGLVFRDYPISETKDRYKLKKYQVEKSDIYQIIQDQVKPNRFIRFIKVDQSYTDENDLVSPIFGTQLQIQLIDNFELTDFKAALPTDGLFVEFTLLMYPNLYILKKVNDNTMAFNRYRIN